MQVEEPRGGAACAVLALQQRSARPPPPLSLQQGGLTKTTFTACTSLAEALERLFEGRGYAAQARALTADHWRSECHPATREVDAIVSFGTHATQ